MTNRPRVPGPSSFRGIREALSRPLFSLGAVALAAALIPACSPTVAPNTNSTSGKGGSVSVPSTGGSSGSTATGGSAAQGGSSGVSTGGQTGNPGTGGSVGQTGGTTGSGGTPVSGTGGRMAAGSGGSPNPGSGGSGNPPATDAAGAETPAAPGAPGCMGVTGKFCSDFETQTAGGAPNGNGDYAVSGAVTVDGAKAFSGTKSLHFKSGGKSQIVFTKQFPFNEQYGRLMMFVLKTPTAAVHWDIVQSNTTVPNIWSWGGMYGKFELVVDPPDDGIDSKTVVPEGKWVCIQWKFGQGTGGKSEYAVMLDGAQVDQSPQNGHWKSGPWKDLKVGWEVFGTAAIEFWIDDLAFGETNIACPGK